MPWRIIVFNYRWNLCFFNLNYAFQKNDKIESYTVVFPHKQGSYAETYRVKDSSGKTRFLKLINYSNSIVIRLMIMDE